MRNSIIKKENITIIGKLFIGIILLFTTSFVFNSASYADTVQNTDEKYLISVNRAVNCITIYRRSDTGAILNSVKSMVCSTAADGVSTPIGTFSLKDRKEWASLTDGTCSLYATRIEGSVFFVGSAYFSTEHSDLDVETYNKLGEAATGNGCIRLNDVDAKWIYDNCEAGTPVEIYDNDGDTRGKPNTIKIPVNHEYAGWDPTDPDENNPWKNLKPRIEGTRDHEINVGEEIDLFEGVKAYDTCGNDITLQMYFVGECDTGKAGTYIVTCVISDAVTEASDNIMEKQVTKDITITVKENGAIAEATTREPVTIATQEDINAKEKQSKILSILALGFVTFVLSIILLKWAKRD